MNRLALVALAFVFAGAPAFAQQGSPPGPGDGPPPDVRAHMDQLRDGARAQAMTALSADHQAKVSAIVGRIKAGQLADIHTAAQQIDAILNPKESQAVLAARDKMIADLRGSAPSNGPEAGGAPPGGSGPGPQGGPDPGGPPPGGPPPGGPPPGGPGQGGPPPGGGFGGPPGGDRHGRMRGMRNDAGFVLISLSLDHDQMRSLFGGGPPH